MADPAPRSVHKPVLLREVLAGLAPRPGETIVDGTVGGGGHAAEIARRLGPTGRLIGLDRDPMMLGLAEARLAAIAGPAVALLHRPYDEIEAAVADSDLETIDGCLVDLGYSSDQLADEPRGFRFDADGPLDLRFDVSTGRPAHDLLDRTDAETLARWLTDYGEIAPARPLAETILAARPITSARHFAEIVAAAGGRHAGGTHPATRAFQALRIAVNDEFGRLERFLREAAPAVVRPGGRLAVISFHSLEDRLVKSAFRDSAVWEITSPKPITGRPAEVRANPRSRSAKLRVATRAEPA